LCRLYNHWWSHHTLKNSLISGKEKYYQSLMENTLRSENSSCWNHYPENWQKIIRNSATKVHIKNLLCHLFKPNSNQLFSHYTFWYRRKIKDKREKNQTHINLRLTTICHVSKDKKETTICQFSHYWNWNNKYLPLLNDMHYK
jgi:hypothetical protein